MANILIIDDDVSLCLMLKTLLEKHGHKAQTIYSPGEAVKKIQKNHFEVILTDLRMPDINGIDLIKQIRKITPRSKVIMITGYADYATAIQSIKEGAFNYIPKPLNPDEVLNIISDALEELEKEENSKVAHQEVNRSFIEGVSWASARLKEFIEAVAPTSMSVLIVGESGTGKEFVARSIHSQSKRASQAFVAVDCGAIPRELVASEFFGHVKGSFTGAIADKAGQFEVANGGTLFLDEVGNLSYETQIQLLRALQERQIKRVGSSKEINVDVRIIAATNENLASLKEDGNFREDLFHRLNEFEIHVPALRERKKDIMIFARHFLEQANASLGKSVEGFDAETEEIFQRYAWPGNLREMNNVIKRAVLLTKRKNIVPVDIPLELSQQPGRNDKFALFDERNEKEKIEKALSAAEFNKSLAARMLKIDRKTLYNKMKYYRIETD